METAKHESGTLRWLLIAFVGFGAALVIFFGAGVIADAQDAAEAPPARTLPLVEVTSVRPVSILTVVEEGFLRPRAEIDVVAEIAGKIVEVAPQLAPGGRFQQGEMLFRIDPRTFEADLARANADLQAARAELARAQADAERQQRLADIGAAAEAQRQASGAALAMARAGVGQADAALTLARKRLGDTVVAAPFNASVIGENVSLGAYVQPGLTVASIFDTSAGEIVLSLRPIDAAAVRRAADRSGGVLDVVVTPSLASAGTASLQGRVVSFGRAVDSRSRTVPLVVEVADAFSTDDASVFANDFVHVSLPAVSLQQTFAAPLGTIRAESFVWKLGEGSKLVRVPATPLQRTDTEVVFSSSEDLTNAQLVLTALTEEAEGIEVEVVNSAARRETLQ